MTIKELKQELSKYPDDIELKDIKTQLVIEKDVCTNHIQSAYLANYRIAGKHPWGMSSHMERHTDLHNVAKAILNGLKLRNL